MGFWLNSTNFNITVWEIGDRNFTDKSTSDLSEGTNLYYTEARVTANTTVAGKADISNVIEKDSTTAFTPTLSTHPVNKNYVDNFSVPDATTSVEGKARLSTAWEVPAWVSTTTIITPADLMSQLKVQPTDSFNCKPCWIYCKWQSRYYGKMKRNNYKESLNLQNQIQYKLRYLIWDMFSTN